MILLVLEATAIQVKLVETTSIQCVPPGWCQWEHLYFYEEREKNKSFPLSPMYDCWINDLICQDLDVVFH